jgi:hypothetical protein
MRTGVVVFIVAIMVAACSQMKIINNHDAMSEIHLGDGLETVIKTLGLPVFRRDIAEQIFVAYFQTNAGRSSDSPVTISTCTPITIKNRRVVAIGQEMTDAWILEVEERKHQVELAEQKKLEQAQRQAKLAEQKKLEQAQRQAKLAEQEKLEQAQRQEKIDSLEKAVKPVPAYNAALNLALYRQLLYLDPDNALYQKRVALYKQRLAMQKKANRERIDPKAKEKALQIWEQTRETRNKKLRQYTGNGIAAMAVQDMGKGSLYVWVKNISQQIIAVHPDQFSLVASDNKKRQCQPSDSLDCLLEPGSISHGNISYSKSIVPKELILQILESDQISKSFQ